MSPTNAFIEVILASGKKDFQIGFTLADQSRILQFSGCPMCLLAPTERGVIAQDLTSLDCESAVDRSFTLENPGDDCFFQTKLPSRTGLGQDIVSVVLTRS